MKSLLNISISASRKQMVAMHSIMIAKHEVQSFVRERTVTLLLIVFLGMALASAFIGWSSQHTIRDVYSFSANQLLSEGRPVPPSPLAANPHLFLAKNMIVYIVLIGSLLAISLGHAAGITDRKSGTVRVLFSHPISKTDFLGGKILGVLIILSLTMLLAAVISTLSSFLLSTLTLGDIARIFGFYTFSLVFLMGFALLGLSFALIMNNDAIALLIPVMLWIIIMFVLPEFSSALYPTASLNLVQPQNSLDNPIINGLHSAITPISISELYKSASEEILNLQDPSNAMNTLNVLPVVVWLVLCFLASIVAIKLFSPAGGELNE